MKNIRTTIVSFSLATLMIAFAGGCSGPTKAGREARDDARARSGMVTAQISYDQARRAFEVGQFDRATREIRTAIDRSPDQPSFYVLEGRIALEQHRLEPAIASFERANEIAQEQLAQLDEVKKRVRSSDDDLRVEDHRERLHAQLAAARYFSGIVFQRWSNHEEAYKRYAHASELDPKNAQYLMAAAESLIALARYEEAEQLIQPRMSYFEHNSAMRHLLGQVAMLQGDAQRAVRLLHEARLLSPDDALLLEELARAQYAAGMYSRSYDSLRLLRTMSKPMDPSNGDGRNGRPVSQFFSTAAQHPSCRPDLIQLEARCLVQMDRLIEARTHLIRLTEIAPSDEGNWIELGSVSFALGDQRRLGMAGERLMIIAPARYEGYFLQAMHERMKAIQAENEAGQRAHLQQSRRLLSEAQRRVNTPSTPDSDKVLVYLMSGQVAEELGDNAAAMSAYAQALRVAPDDPDAGARLEALRGSEQVASVPID